MRIDSSPERWRRLRRVGLFEKVGFESRQELTAGDSQKWLGRVVRIRSVEEPKRWGEGFPESWNEVMETAV